MTATSQPVPASSEQLSEVLALACFVVLLFIAVLQRVFVLPVFVSLMSALDKPFSRVSSAALSIQGISSLMLLAFFATLALLAARRRRDARAARQFRLTLLGGNLVMAVYVAMLSWSFVDVAIHLPGAVVRRPVAVAPPVR
jgi:glucan phosphoethanolaminetransferase (alkaline phosphatase superfamily)